MDDEAVRIGVEKVEAWRSWTSPSLISPFSLHHPSFLNLKKYPVW